jgi:lipoate---protein ligase
MFFLDLTLSTPAENLACDDALLEECAQKGHPPVLRVWESPVPFVVVGYGNPRAEGVDLLACQRHSLSVLRRSSGGGSVVQGPGCLNYTLILPIPEMESHPLRSIRGSHAYVIQRHARSLRDLLGPGVQARGWSDLALETRKFSGNAQRRGHSHLLLHGTFLLNFELPLIELALAIPRSQPPYRVHRSHRDFLINTGLSRSQVIERLRTTWSADHDFGNPPWNAIQRLAVTRYQTSSWMVLPQS